jgi:glycosyltransferase involved in cell wall biosynthesis
LKILQVHNAYRELGGEDVVVEREMQMLLDRGHEVQQYLVSNRALDVRSPSRAAAAALRTVWSRDSYARVGNAVAAFNPDVVHIHNTFPQLSPSIVWSVRARHVPVVQSLHNYRLACANALLLRQGSPCEACVGRLPISAVRWKCYRGSMAATLPVALSQAVHGLVGTNRHRVNAHIVFSEFARSVMLRAGLSPKSVFVKAHSVPDPRPTLMEQPRRNQVVFVGRLASEKGVDILVNAWRRTRPVGWRLVVIGDGPERISLTDSGAGIDGIEWRGWLGEQDVLQEMQRSRFLVMPSRWYETFGLVLVEAMAVGTPAIVPRHGVFPEIVGDEALLFAPGSTDDLAVAIASATNMAEEQWLKRSGAARRRFEDRFTIDVNYRKLVEIYDAAQRDMT